jgi:hypothetical protein
LNWNEHVFGIPPAALGRAQLEVGPAIGPTLDENLEKAVHPAQHPMNTTGWSVNGGHLYHRENVAPPAPIPTAGSFLQIRQNDFHAISAP